MLILYGSQTGTAEEFSNTLAQDAKKYGFNAVAKDMVDFEPDQISNEKLVILMVATYGEGEPTDNARDFYEYYKDTSISSDMLSGVKFSVFGLGNKQYKIYQAMARFFDKRFEELGGERFFRKGEGDADADIEEDFEEWKSHMLLTASDIFSTTITEEEEEYEPKFTLDFLKKNIAMTPFKSSSSAPDAKHPFLATISKKEQLLKSSGSDNRSTVHVDFNITDSGIKYEAGDHLAVYPANNENLVNAYLARIGITNEQADAPFQLRNHKDNRLASYFPKDAMTLRIAFTYYMDLNELAKKKAFKVMAHYAQNESERTELKLLASNSEEGKAKYNSFVKEGCRNVLEVLNHFTSVKLPVDGLLEIVPKMQVRYYSIASSSQLHPNTISAVVAVVKYTTPIGANKEGVCSSYLERIDVDKKAFIYVRQSSFRLPQDPKTPVIMVGPGTGIAPFLGFLEQRTAMKNRGVELGPCHLYFGCRKRGEDYIYSEEMEKAERDGVISLLDVAFSRDQGNKVYVQHRLESRSEELFNFLNNGGYFYICGDAKHMAKDVENVMLNSIQKYGRMTEKDAQDYLEKLGHRYQKDVWSN
ncbi:NADPH-cytochrome P450 oxidoreductase [Naegleria gruberi]|uniref:NADPH--hemoprotein reductase n=1 Tax=Naegleria gruberi TaxID=5762 RepID=D2UY68_NAEGR|nr:NADPH-cytochrome P450 oxidoreductase [Naegleria gruberi]EFC50742.1 NADPH-cytochrome P450 oxidoreductase [Naegleria gruberi]|eukprot:XP_002683486.1 NADPH-cytochrome P450 oxidoreductase [Naegleria gruberi strain NEG-M]